MSHDWVSLLCQSQSQSHLLALPCTCAGSARRLRFLFPWQHSCLLKGVSSTDVALVLFNSQSSGCDSIPARSIILLFTCTRAGGKSLQYDLVEHPILKPWYAIAFAATTLLGGLSTRFWSARRWICAHSAKNVFERSGTDVIQEGQTHFKSLDWGHRSGQSSSSLPNSPLE